MRRRLLGALGTSLACLFACNFVATRQLANAFNEGVLDSQNDPTYSRSQRATDTVMWRMRDELGEGYFGQGSSPTEREARVVAWMKLLQSAAPKFMETSLRAYFSGDASMEMPTASDNDGGGLDKHAPASQQKIQDALAQHVPGIAPRSTPMCDGTTPKPKSIEALADYVRFRVALQKAVDVVAKLVDERFATMPEIVAGAERAFGDTATYLGDRTWKRELDHHVTGLVVKGGAATGVFSSGVVWVALNVIDQCIRSGKCDPKNAGFALASGTSTGATVVGATDIFHTDIADDTKRATALDHYLNWYLCSSMNDLYCVRNGSAFDLARGDGAHGKDVQDSMLDFDGLAAKIEDNYHCPEMTNGMELILNTVDFRTGRLYSLSDQDPATLGGPWDVAKAIVSSAALPFIVRPTYHLPVDPLGDAGNFAYLDGGIRSELPLLALVRRGVERLLVVSSGASITGDDKELPNSLGMAIRYIDISTGGVTEAEIDHAQTRVEATRLAEYEYCTSLLRHESMEAVAAGRPPLCNGTCDIDYLCSGDFKRVCTRDSAHFHPLQDNEQIVQHTFQMTNVWRNEGRIPGLPGYAFNPVEQRRLMLAGAEAAREKCMQIASTLGIEVGDGPGQVDRDTLYKWCTPRLPSTKEQCPVRADSNASKGCARLPPNVSRAGAERGRPERAGLREGTMMQATRSMILALALVTLVTTSAAAEDTGVPPVPGALPPGPSSPYLLAGPRFLETNASIATLLDSNPRLDAAKDARTGRSSFVTGMDVGIPFVNQRVRPSLFAGIQLGYWGDDAHGPVTAYPGARFRGSFYMDDIFDMYALVRADFPITGVNGNVAAAFRPGLGIGLRVARAVSLEGSYDVIVPIGSQFTPTQYASFVPIGMTISLLIDTCFTCMRSEKKPKNRNMACRLYNLAKDVSTPAVRDAICAAIPKAMIACPDPLVAKREEDGASTFLATLQDSESGDAKAAVKRLVDLHAALLQQWTRYEEEAARQAAEKRALAERWSYAPVPAELRSYFGCDGNLAPPTCTEVTPE